MLTFRGSNAEAYELHMGRWSRLLAAPFIDFARIAGAGRPKPAPMHGPVALSISQNCRGNSGRVALNRFKVRN